MSPVNFLEIQLIDFSYMALRGKVSIYHCSGNIGVPQQLFYDRDGCPGHGQMAGEGMAKVVKGPGHFVLFQKIGEFFIDRKHALIWPEGILGIVSFIPKFLEGI